MTELHWLPETQDWPERSRALCAATADAWASAIALANTRLNFVRTNALDTLLHQATREPPANLVTPPVRLAVLGSSTLTHLLPAIRVGGLRRGIWIDTFEGAYGQFRQELADPSSALHRFQPNAALLALDAHHLAAGVSATMDRQQADAARQAVIEEIRSLWRQIHDALRCPVLHQIALPLHLPVLGGNEHRLPGSKARFIEELNAELRRMADTEGVDLLALDEWVACDGLARWHDPALWHRAKQEIVPTAAPFLGDLVGRWLGALRGRSAKCLVLDLDNTLWGGVIGDDGLGGIELGQGSPLGEAFAAFQQHVRDLSHRGVILAVCSKNDAAVAMEAFDRHPEMVLRRSDIACFVANWTDKATNLRTIAEELNIGLDSLVFVDDNPFERGLVRRELPMVAVPELGDDPTYYAATLADAGYFEALAVTDDDRQRGASYQANRLRSEQRANATDLNAYLRDLDMRLVWRRFDQTGLKRIVQLINKSNQFNLRTRRYTEDEILAVIDDPTALGLQLRLLDRFGDNGVIAIIIGRRDDAGDLFLDTWVMSCRVLGRGVEAATLNLIMHHAAAMDAARVVGEYRPTERNGMVRDHYTKLAFEVAVPDGHGIITATRPVGSYTPVDVPMRIEEGGSDDG